MPVFSLLVGCNSYHLQLIRWFDDLLITCLYFSLRAFVATRVGSYLRLPLTYPRQLKISILSE